MKAWQLQVVFRSAAEIAVTTFRTAVTRWLAGWPVTFLRDLGVPDD